MSGTSADGVDAALLFTDGKAIVQAGASVFVGYDAPMRAAILGAMQGYGDRTEIGHALTRVHAEAVAQLLAKAGMQAREIALIGFHGQTVEHNPAQGYTVQMGDPAWLAQATGIPVIADFRSNDMRHGGQGAPLVPLYHAALAHALPKPLMVVNIGGVSNVTWVGGERSEARGQRSDKDTCLWPLASDLSLLAFDCGPGNALLDDWVARHTGARFDAGGALAAQGAVHTGIMDHFLADPFFAAPAPKSLDRNHFHALLSIMEPLSPADGAATLTAMTAEAIAKAAELAPIFPRHVLVTGGGRHNPTMMGMIEQAFRVRCAAFGAVRTTHRTIAQQAQTAMAQLESDVWRKGVGVSLAGMGSIGDRLVTAGLFRRLFAPFLWREKWLTYGAQECFSPELNGAFPATPATIAAIESVGFNGDMLEAEAFAYLAARSAQGLPLSLPTTTGTREAVTGGVMVES